MPPCRLQQQCAPEPIQLRFPPAHPALGQRRQRLGERFQPLGGLPYFGGCLGEQGQVIRAVPCHPRRSVGGQALLDLCFPLLPRAHSRLAPSPVGAWPAPIVQETPGRSRRSWLASARAWVRGASAGAGDAARQPGARPGMRLTGWASCCARASAAWMLATAWSGWGGAEGQRRLLAATHPRVVPAVAARHGRGAAPARRVAALVLVHPGGGQLAVSEQAGPQGVVGLEQEVRVLEALGQAEELFPQRPRRLIFASRVIASRVVEGPAGPRGPAAGEEGCRGGASYPLTQLACPGAPLFPPRGRQRPWSPATPYPGSSARPAPAGGARGSRAG